MKKISKKLLGLACGVFACVSVMAGPNDIFNYTNGITFISAGGTSNSAVALQVANHEEVALQYRKQWSSANAAGTANTAVDTIGASMVPSNFVAIATITTLVPTNSTLTKDVGTNIYLGSYRYFAFMSSQNNATNSTCTNLSTVGNIVGVVSVQIKQNRN